MTFHLLTVREKMPTSLDDKKTWEASLTKVNLSIIKQFEGMIENSKSLVEDIKEIYAEEIQADDITVTVLMELADRLVDYEAEFFMYLRREILNSNQKSLEIRRLYRKIKLLESTSLN